MGKLQMSVNLLGSQNGFVTLWVNFGQHCSYDKSSKLVGYRLGGYTWCQSLRAAQKPLTYPASAVP